MRHELVQNWMTKDPITVSPDTTLPEAHAKMKSADVRRLLVTDEQGALVGIITEGDLRRVEASPATSLSIWELNYLLNRLEVKEFMTANPITVTAENTIGEAARLMLEEKISGLPVVNAEGNLIGIITESDIFTMVVLHEWREELEEDD